MKRLCIILFIFFIGIGHVLAEENVFWTDKQISDPNYSLINQERRYMWYKEIPFYSDIYYVEGDNPEEYSYIIRNDNMISDYSDWSNDFIPKTKPNRIIEARSVYKYRVLKPVRYILFHNFRGGFITFNINELNILIDNSEINYTGECTNCINPSYLNNGVVDGFQTIINNGGDLKIDLGDYYSVGRIKIELYMYDYTPNVKRVDIYMNDTDTLMEDSFIHKTFETSVVSQTYDVPERHFLIPDQTWVARQDFMDWIYTDNFYNTTYYRQMVIDTEFRFKDILYRYYGINKEYLDGYYLESNDSQYIKDVDQYKDFYLYQKNTSSPSENEEENTNNEDINNDQTNNSDIGDNQENDETIDNNEESNNDEEDKADDIEKENINNESNNKQDTAINNDTKQVKENSGKSKDLISNPNDNRQIVVNKIPKPTSIRKGKIFNLIPNIIVFLALLIGIILIIKRKKVKSVV